MELSKTKITEQPKNGYFIEVETMTGDGDDYHNFEIPCENEDEVKSEIIKLEVISKQYPNGRGGYDTYNELPFWDDFEDWPYGYDGEIQDELDSFEVYWYNDNVRYKVSYTLSEQDNEEIKSFGVLTY